MFLWEFYRTGSSDAVFKLSNLSFPPNVVMQPSLFESQFQVGPAWAKALGYTDGPSAVQGYYIVIRACNPERVEWLTWAARAGVRTLSKPLCIKAKSLKAGGYLKGLVG